MKIEYAKKPGVLMLCIAVSLTLFASFLLMEPFGAPTGLTFVHFLYWFISAACYWMAALWTIAFVKLKKGVLNPKVHARMSAITCFVMVLLVAAWGIVSIFNFSPTGGIGFFFATAGLSVLPPLFSLWFIFEARKQIRNGLDGYSVLRTQAWAVFALLLAMVVYYASVLPKAQLLFQYATSLPQPIETGQEVTIVFNGWLIGFLVLVGVGFLLDGLFLLQLFYCGFSLMVSSLENTAMDLRSNLKASKYYLEKYDISFWFSVLISAILGIVALVAVLRVELSYVGLVALYAALLVMKIPSYFYRRHIELRHRGQDYLIFRKKHRILIWSGVSLLVLGVIGIIYGTGSITKFNSSFNAVIVYLIFVPYSILRIVFGTRNYFKSIKLGEPYVRIVAEVDILIAIFVLANTIYMVAAVVNRENPQVGGVFLQIATVISFVMVGYVILIAVKTTVVGILGVAGKMKKVYDAHEEDIKRINQERFHTPKFPKPSQEASALEIVKTEAEIAIRENKEED